MRRAVEAALALAVLAVLAAGAGIALAAGHSGRPVRERAGHAAAGDPGAGC